MLQFQLLKCLRLIFYGYLILCTSKILDIYIYSKISHNKSISTNFAIILSRLISYYSGLCQNIDKLIQKNMKYLG